LAYRLKDVVRRGKKGESGWVYWQRRLFCLRKVRWPGRTDWLRTGTKRPVRGGHLGKCPCPVSEEHQNISPNPPEVWQRPPLVMIPLLKELTPKGPPNPNHN
jgi:hypothetical protein